MSDPFLDLFLRKVKELKVPAGSGTRPKIALRPLPEPKGSAAGVDGGGGAARVSGKSFRVARAVAVGEGHFDRELELELSPWESSAALEALRSSVELEVASRVKGRVLLDGSAYTPLSKWITRVIRVAMGRAKLSEIIALPKTLEALGKLEELGKKRVTFVSKSPMIKIFKEYLLLKEQGELFEKYVRGRLSRKELKELGRRRELFEPSADVDLIEGEGVSVGLRLGLQEPLKNLLLPSKWKRVLDMALENYKLYTNETYDGRLPKDLCFLGAPVAWWASYGRWKVLIEELGDKPLCLARYREEVGSFPEGLPELLAGAGSTYNVWLTLAHSLSTLKGEQMLEYIKLMSIQKGLGLDEIREELIYVM
ncbi:MAG: DNA double-strand break repair nuclease NurA [Crenarchaeota archaeon]|nr:DNA double-strand break repair nuclease NurA [Thermoproteota archaeon]